MSDSETTGTGYQYTLVVGPDAPDRAWLEGILMRGGLEVAACTEAELLAMPDIVPPQLVILDDASTREERMASFANLRAHRPLVGVPLVVLAYDADIDSFSAAITRGAETGKIGDGKIFVHSLGDVIRIRTGERGGAAV